jgi:hypothetical protein
MIELNESLFFAKGSTRKCFFHPNDANLCIKVPLINEGKRTRGILKAISRENVFYKKLKKRGISWRHLSEYKGDVDTNLGKGSVYQLIRDHDGSVSKSLENYLESNYFVQNVNVLLKLLDDLYLYIQKNRILTTSLLPRNIVINKTINDFKLVIVDDIGNSEFLPISQFIPILAEKKIKRKWDRMIDQIKICTNNFDKK